MLPFAALIEPCNTTDGEIELLGDASSRAMTGRAITAFAALMLWTQGMQLFVFSTRLAALTWNLGVMFEDVSRNLVVMLTFIFAFASALTALNEDNFGSLDEGLYALVRQVLKLKPPDSTDMHPISHFFLFTFVITCNIGMISILIAQIRSSYAVVAEKKIGYAIQHRASICVDIESILPLSYRSKIFRSFSFNVPCSLDQGDAGPCGGIQVFCCASIRQHDKYVPDRIRRYTGEASPLDPWDEGLDEEIEEEEEEVQ